MRSRALLGALSALLVSAVSATASAQFNPYQPQPQPGPYTTGYPQPYPGYAPQTPQQPYVPSKVRSTPLEIGYLYITAASWGVATGIWIDAMAEVKEPAVAGIAPVVFGAAAPAAVFIADRPPMQRGLPSAIATGIILGTGEGLNISLLQHVASDEADEWAFKGIMSAQTLGSVVGGVAGGVSWYFARQSPKTNLFLASAAVWGEAIGTAIGGGASSGKWGVANDAVMRGGVVGFNIALAGAIGVSAVWRPSWNQLGWMWLGLGAGAVISTPVYAFYAGSDSDPRRGLIFQGVAATLGVAGFALLGTPDPKGTTGELEDNDYFTKRHKLARFLGASPMPLPSGMGVQAIGELW